MVDILHRVGIKSSVAEVYAALTTADGLAGWWTTNTQGEGKDLGGVLQFRFGAGGFDMEAPHQPNLNGGCQPSASTGHGFRAAARRNLHR
jgi:hypothetical protein